MGTGISARVMPVSHGQCAQSKRGTYESSAWFIRNDATYREFLFFGDVEPDTISLNPRTSAVWRAAAPKIRAGRLDTIFLECSYQSNRPTSQLFGHLSPPHVLNELRSLATELVLANQPTKPKPKRSCWYSFFWSLFGYRTSEPVRTLPDNELQGALKGLRLIVTHCKATTDDFPEGQTIADAISSEIRDLVDAAGLGISIVAAKQGMKLGERRHVVPS